MNSQINSMLTKIDLSGNATAAVRNNDLVEFTSNAATLGLVDSSLVDQMQEKAV
jgi:hypothetical protein